MKSIHKERERIHDYEEKYYKDKKEMQTALQEVEMQLLLRRILRTKN